jgi:uncharacterized protein (TIGR02996 family)
VTTADSDFAAFLQAVLARPDDDLPRLIFADWLDENGQSERAEFIRIGCELATLPDPHQGIDVRAIAGATGKLACRCRWCALCRRWAELQATTVELNGHRTHGYYAWAPPHLTHPNGGARCVWEYRRGFIERVELPAAYLLEYAAALFAAAPILDVRLSDRRPGVPGGTWYQPSDGGILADHRLPSELFLRLRGGGLAAHNMWRRWDTAADAHAALSAACVAWAREQAKLPPLPARRREAARA